jgi:hypothetical protein
MTRLDGRNLFEWKAEYNELAARFIEYADHTAACYTARGGHKHHPLSDDRIVCHMAPCTCGLLIILSVLNPTITYGMHCPDVPTPLPTRQIFNEKPPDATDTPTPDNIIVLESMPKPTDYGY